MNVDELTSMQVLVAWRGIKLVVLRDAVELGSYPYRAHAMDVARTLHAEAIAKNAEDPLVSAAAAFKEGDDAYEVRSFFSFSLVFPRDGVS